VPRICVDMDEVMADTLAEHLRRYNQTFDEDVTPDDLAGKGLWEVAPLDRQQQLRAFLDAEDFFEDLALMPGAQEVLEQLSARFEIFIATQAMAVPTPSAPNTAGSSATSPLFHPTTMSFVAANPSYGPTILSTTSPGICCASRARACSTPHRTTSPLPASLA